MTDTAPKFDPIPRLQQIAATIEESGADIFDAPATAVHYIECAIKENPMTKTKKTVDRRVTVSGIRYWTHWTITANLDIEFEQNPNTGLWQHTATHVGVEDGDITAVHDNPNAYPVLKFSNGSGFKAVDWARKTAEIGMNLGDKDDWIDAVYSSNEVASAVNDLLLDLNQDW